jgi:hypothetical protein
MKDPFTVGEEADVVVETCALLAETEDVRPSVGRREDDRISRPNQTDRS